MNRKIFTIFSFLLMICSCKMIYSQDTLLYKVISVDSIEMPELIYIITLENNETLYKVFSLRDTTIKRDGREIIHCNDYLLIELKTTNKIKIQENSYLYVYDSGLLYLGRVILEQGEYPYLSNQIINNYYLPFD